MSPRDPRAPDPPIAAPAVFFDRFELRPDDRLLLRDGEPVALRAKAFDVLALLVERAGHLVSKAELLDRVWAGVVVEENNIASQMAALRKVVGGDLVTTVPGRGYRFVADVRRTATAAADGPDATAGSVPTPESSPPPAGPDRIAPRLFGRDDDLARMLAALDVGGCVTLTGPGGVGKTVLGQALVRARPARRAAWVDLAALDDGAQLAGAVCRALGIATPADPAERRDAVGAALGAGARWLVLDNAEHLVDSVAALCATLADALPPPAVLVTSQLPLRIAGERVHALEPLGLPAETAPADASLESASMQMIVSRIQAADGRLALGADAWPALRRLCARLDGLPLAIEMAASMVPLLGVAGTLAALDERFAVLRRGRREAPARHKTLRAALEWSHGLLSPAQQRALRRLGVFASSFSLPLAAAVTADPGEDRWDAVDTFGELVERSLVASLHTEPPRYHLLESVRSFALEALESAAGGEAAATRLRAVRALTEAMAEPRADVAAAELANVPDALRWAREHDGAAAIALALAAGNVATWTPWRGEAARWIEGCEPLLGAGVPLALQAEWWRELARFQTFVRGPRAVEAARQAAALERTLGNAEGRFWSLVPLLRSRVTDAAEFDACRAEAEALLAAHPEWPARARAVFSGSLALEYRRRGDFEEALVHQQAEAEQAHRAGLHQLARNAESNVAATLNGLGRHEQALALLDARDIAPAAGGDGDDPVVAHDDVQRLNALIGLGRRAEAEALAPQALARCRRFDVLDIEQVLALLQALQGRADAAAQVLGHYRAALVRLGAEPPDDRHAPWRAAQRIVETVLGVEALERLMAQGATLERAGADAAMLRGPDAPGASPA